MPRLRNHNNGLGSLSPEAREQNIPGSKNVPKTATNNVALSRILVMVGGTRLSARIITVMTDNAALVRMNRYTIPCNGSEVIDTTTDGIDNTRVAMRKPSVRLSEVAVEAFRTSQSTPARLSVPLTGTRGDAAMITRGSMSNAASMVENVFNS